MNNEQRPHSTYLTKIVINLTVLFLTLKMSFVCMNIKHKGCVYLGICIVG